jgi:hypothetical protein
LSAICSGCPLTEKPLEETTMFIRNAWYVRRRRQQRRKPRLALDQRPSAQVSHQVDFRQNAAEDRD